MSENCLPQCTCSKLRKFLTVFTRDKILYRFSDIYKCKKCGKYISK